MKNNFITEFAEHAETDFKTAFIYKRGLKYYKKSYNEFINDVYRMNAYLEGHLKGNRVLIFSYPYDYLFFVGIFSCVFLGKDIVIIDSFKDKNKTKKMMKAAEVTDVICDSFTSRFKFLLPERHNVINLKYYESSSSLRLINDDSSIITFTSGTTGDPKVIKRDLGFLNSQIELIKDNMEIKKNDVTYGLLPMYTLLSVLMNNTCLVSRRISDCNRFNVTMLLAPIKKVQRVKQPITSVERCFLGGAILYKSEAKDIVSKLPNADITYVYGASEGALIYKTKLQDYCKETFTFTESSKGIDVEIINQDENGIGEIKISGETVLGNDNMHCTGDLGKIQDGKLIIFGRKKYSNGEQRYYNYLYDEAIREGNPYVKKAFSFYYNGKIHVAYSGRLMKKYNGIVYHHYKRLPYDLKHNTKLDYGKVIGDIEGLSHKKKEH